MDYFPRKSLSKYLITDTIDFNKHVHDIVILINDKWRKYVGSDIGRLFKITRLLELRFWPTRKRSQPSQGDFFDRISLQREPCPNLIVQFYVHTEIKRKTVLTYSVHEISLRSTQKCQGHWWSRIQILKVITSGYIKHN